jgi:hypothetical protein
MADHQCNQSQTESLLVTLADLADQEEAAGNVIDTLPPAASQAVQKAANAEWERRCDALYDRFHKPIRTFDDIVEKLEFVSRHGYSNLIEDLGEQIMTAINKKRRAA